MSLFQGSTCTSSHLDISVGTRLGYTVSTSDLRLYHVNAVFLFLYSRILHVHCPLDISVGTEPRYTVSTSDLPLYHVKAVFLCLYSRVLHVHRVGRTQARRPGLAIQSVLLTYGCIMLKPYFCLYSRVLHVHRVCGHKRGDRAWLYSQYF